MVAIAGAGGCGDTPYYAGDGYGRGTGLAVSLLASGAEDPEAISFLGEALHTAPRDLSESAARGERLEAALAAYGADPTDLDHLLELGASYFALGLYRREIEVYTEGLEAHPGDGRLLLARGHRHLTVREPGRAEADLAAAMRALAGGDHRAKETSGWYLLGIANYLQGDYEAAVAALRNAVALAPAGADRYAAMDWMWMSLHKSGRPSEARELIAAVRPDVEGLGAPGRTYHRHLLMYRGLIPPDAVIPDLADLGSSRRTHAPDYAGIGGALQMATSGFAVGNLLLLRGDTAGAERIFGAVLETRMWPALGYMAAEAELARSR